MFRLSPAHLSIGWWETLEKVKKQAALLDKGRQSWHNQARSSQYLSEENP